MQQSQDKEVEQKEKEATEEQEEKEERKDQEENNEEQEESKDAIDEEFCKMIEAQDWEGVKNYIKNNKPSFVAIIRAFSKAMESSPEFKADFFQNLPKTLNKLLELHVARLFIRVILTYVKQNPALVDMEAYNQQNLKKLWTHVQLEDVRLFCECFKFELQPEEQGSAYQKQLKFLISKKKFDEAYKLIKCLELDKQYLYDLINGMDNNYDCSKAADFIKKANLPLKEFGNIYQRLQKKCVRYYIHEYPWYQCEEMLGHTKKLLVYLAEDLFYRNLTKEAFSIIERNDLVELIEKEEVREAFDPKVGVNNCLYAFDSFRPSDPKVVTLEELGISEEKVVFVQDNAFWKEIFESAAVGLDSEFISSHTKLDDQSMQLLQLATPHKVFLVDLPFLKDCPEFRANLTRFVESIDVVKVGLGIKQDFKFVLHYLGITQIIARKILDLAQVYLAMNPDQKKNSLDHIVQVYLHKPLTKFEQCSNWAKRPLRKAQIHYAALDAFVCLEVLNKMKQVHDPALVENELDQIHF